MSKSIYVVGGVAVVAAAGVAAYLAMRSTPEAVLEDRWAMVDKYCVGCHNDAELTADVSFEHCRLGGRDQEAAARHDAAARRAAAGNGGAR